MKKPKSLPAEKLKIHVSCKTNKKVKKNKVSSTQTTF